MASPGTLMVLHNLKTDKHLNNVLAIILTEPDPKSGRHAVQLMDGTTHKIKSTNMAPYIKHAAPKGKTYTVKDIVKALKKLLPKFRGGALLSNKIDVLDACCRRITLDVELAEQATSRCWWRRLIFTRTTARGSRICFCGLEV